jgi:hypothetical protein
MTPVVVVVPTTALILQEIPGGVPPALADVADAARAAVAAVGPVDVAIALVGSTAEGIVVSDAPSADLAGYGLPSLPVHDLASAPADVVEALLEIADGETGDARARTGPDLAVLARLVPEGVPTVGVALPPGTSPDRAADLADVILAVTTGRLALILVAGDLGAGHGPKPPRPEAAEASDRLQAAVLAALDGADVGSLLDLDGSTADASGARATGALRVLGAVADRTGTSMVVQAHATGLGVGCVVASSA